MHSCATGEGDDEEEDVDIILHSSEDDQQIFSAADLSTLDHVSSLLASRPDASFPSFLSRVRVIHAVVEDGIDPLKLT